MATEQDWEFPRNLQPKPAELGFDLDSVLASILGLHTEIPGDAFTAGTLGTERSGNGIVIREDGLVLTIGYLVTEAKTIWLTTHKGSAVGGYPLAYDQATGFGLVQALGRLDLPALPRGSSAAVNRGDPVVLAAHGGRGHCLNAKVIAKHEFAGYWEYVLDEALFTAPAHPHWGGAALIDRSGRLAGIGSLLVEEKAGDKEVQGNMIVPIDLLEPILNDLLTYGRVNHPPRPWIGFYATEIKSHVAVAGLAKGGPAETAKLEVGDVVLEVAEEPVRSLADLFRKIWRCGDAGVEVPFTIARTGGQVLAIKVRSADRSDFLKKPKLH
ncbi:MAG: serine protease [Alphaproteobacteria bacterium]|nr:serine protease [Alphaproteobacteria bacterium]